MERFFYYANMCRNDSKILEESCHNMNDRLCISDNSVIRNNFHYFYYWLFYSRFCHNAIVIAYAEGVGNKMTLWRQSRR